MNIPSEAEWGDWQTDLDQQSAHEVFAGRSAADVRPLFAENVIERTNDVRFMPAIPFRYYMLAFRDYVLADAVRQDDASDAASCFLNLVEQKLESERAAIDPIVRDLLGAVDCVAENQAAFDAPVEIYGDFTERAARIRALAAG
jgi:hypothetical protein